LLLDVFGGRGPEAWRQRRREGRAGSDRSAAAIRPKRRRRHEAGGLRPLRLLVARAHLLLQFKHAAVIGFGDAIGVGAALPALKHPRVLVLIEPTLLLWRQAPVRVVVYGGQLVIEVAERLILADRGLVGVMRVPAIEALRLCRIGREYRGGRQKAESERNEVRRWRRAV
jgi:hypothetical protein